MAEEAKKSKLAELQDLIHLEPPINEDLVLRALQSRFFSKKFFVSTYSAGNLVLPQLFLGFIFSDQCRTYFTCRQFIQQCWQPSHFGVHQR